MKTFVLFNDSDGAGKTTLVYHLAHMLTRLGHRTLAVDLDPQAHLTSAFFDEDRLEKIWDDGKDSILAGIQPRMTRTGDIAGVDPIEVAEGLCVIPGDLGIARFEDRLSQSWPGGFVNDENALRDTTSFFRIIHQAGESTESEIALIDVGPNFSAVNRAALLSADGLLVPLAADLFSFQGLRNLGPIVRKWRQDWHIVMGLAAATFEMPRGNLEPIGYVVVQHAVRLDRPAKSFVTWMDRIQTVYREAVLNKTEKEISSPDPECLAILRNYSSLIPMSQDARKPMFDLRPADGAIGSHAALVDLCYQDFEKLAKILVKYCKAGRL